MHPTEAVESLRQAESSHRIELKFSPEARKFSAPIELFRKRGNDRSLVLCAMREEEINVREKIDA